MNERIKQLAEQANTIGDWGEDITEGRYFVYPNIKNLEKFAELIVLKCAEIADTAEPFLASDLIKQQFGVTE
jgi:hypothetical protein